MNRLFKRFDLVVLGLAIILIWSLPANAANYNMKDLGVLPGGTYSVATAINNAGVIVGYGDTLVGTTLRTHAFSYAGGKMTDLGTVTGWSWSKAYAINDAGQIVGEGGTELPKYPFLYAGGVMTQVAPPPALESGSVAYGINADHIVGYGNWINNTYNDHAFLYALPEGGFWTWAPWMGFTALPMPLTVWAGSLGRQTQPPTRPLPFYMTVRCIIWGAWAGSKTIGAVVPTPLIMPARSWAGQLYLATYTACLFV